MVGDVLRAWRAERGLTQAEAAESLGRAGVRTRTGRVPCQALVSRWENGVRYPTRKAEAMIRGFIGRS